MFRVFPGWLAIAVLASMLLIRMTFAHADGVARVTDHSDEATNQGKSATILTSPTME